MFNKKKLVIELASKYDFHELPKPAKSHLANWYKAQSPNLEDYPVRGGTLKQCVPFLDSMMSGYIATLWADIVVTKDINGHSVINWKSPIDENNNQIKVVETRGIDGSAELPVPAGHCFQRFAWCVPYFTRTPKDYSILITHPFNRFDLPFTTLTGLVDTETTMYAGNVPFFIKADFEGIIHKGTPLYQILPFKRENWNSIENTEIIKEGLTNERKSASVFTGWYKNNAWFKKEYN